MNTKTAKNSKTATATATVGLGKAAELVGCTRQYLYKVATKAAGSTTSGLKVVKTVRSKGAKRATRLELDAASVKTFAREYAKRNA